MKEVKQLIQHCLTTKYCSFDFETSSLKYYEKREVPLCLGVSFQPGSSWVIPLAHSESPLLENKQWKKALRLFGKKVLENWDVIKIAWNFKFEYKWLMRYGIICKGRLFDAQLAKYCLDEERPNDLKSWVSRLFPQYANYEDEIGGKKEGTVWADIPLKSLAKYCGIDSDLTFRLMSYFEGRLIKLGFYNLFRNLLMMGTRVLAESEYDGMIIDKPYLLGLMDKYSKLITEVEGKLNAAPALLKFNKKMRKHYIDSFIEKVELEIAELEQDDTRDTSKLIANRYNKIKAYREGHFNKKEAEKLEGINWNSPKQVIDFFYAKKYGGSNFGLKLKPQKFTDTGNPSTDEEALLALKDQDKSGFIDILLELRGLNTLNSTFIQGMYNLMGTDDKVHANFKIFGTVTGRLSCEKPNLQNIPRGTTSGDIKLMFIPPPGKLLLEVDYSQAELRVVAELAKDKAMIDIFNKNWNIHVATACKINGGLHLYDKVKSILKDENHPDWLFWEKQKKRAKTINFGILYGQTEKKLSKELECTEQEAKEFIKQWYAAYPQVAKWIKKQIQYAHKHGHVYSLFGRKRRLHQSIYSDKFGTVLEAERQAVNTPIQGTASDFGLLSQIVIRELKLRGKFPKDMQQAYTVHDSIGYYIDPADINRIVPEVVKVCDNPNTLKYFGFELKDVKMKVSPEVGRNWFDKHDWDPWVNYKNWVKPAA